MSGCKVINNIKKFYYTDKLFTNSLFTPNYLTTFEAKKIKITILKSYLKN